MIECSFLSIDYNLGGKTFSLLIQRRISETAEFTHVLCSASAAVAVAWFYMPQLNKQCLLLEIVTVKFVDQKCGWTKSGKKRKQSVGFSNQPCTVFNWREVTTKTITNKGDEST